MGTWHVLNCHWPGVSTQTIKVLQATYIEGNSRSHFIPPYFIGEKHLENSEKKTKDNLVIE